MVNELSVVPTKAMGDELIPGDIRAVFERRIDIDVEDVDIRVENGMVTLSGSVPTWTAQRAAVEAAGYTLGVTAVVDRLLVAAP